MVSVLHLRQSLLCLKSSQNLVIKQQQCFRKYVGPEASQASTHYLNRISSVNLNTEVMSEWQIKTTASCRGLGFVMTLLWFSSMAVKGQSPYDPKEMAAALQLVVSQSRSTSRGVVSHLRLKIQHSPLHLRVINLCVGLVFKRETPPSKKKNKKNFNK